MIWPRTCSSSAVRLHALVLLGILSSSCVLPRIGPPAGGPYEDQNPGQAGKLQDYKEEHYLSLGKTITGTVDWSGFLEEARSSRVLYLGDHHRNRELHAAYMDLLRGLLEAGIKPVLGLEAIATQDNELLQDYLSGAIDMRRLRQGIRRRWPGSWLDNKSLDTEFFQGLLLLAKEEELPVFPIEPAPRGELDARDVIIAENILRANEAYPESLIVVVVGHVHLLGPGHLRERVPLPSTMIGADMSVSLEKARQEMGSQSDLFLRSESGVLFYNPDR